MTARTILVTRTMPGAEETAAKLRARGAIAILSPALTIETLSAPAPSTTPQALAFTSGHAPSRTPPGVSRETPAFAVGAATAAAARAAGFQTVASADGDVAALAGLLQARLLPRGGPILYVRGADVAQDLAAMLAAFGLKVEERIAYQASPATSLSAEAQRALDAGAIGGALFHSARGARIIEPFLGAHRHNMVAYCISPAVAAALDSRAWRKLDKARRPDDESLIALALA